MTFGVILGMILVVGALVVYRSHLIRKTAMRAQPWYQQKYVEPKAAAKKAVTEPYRRKRRQRSSRHRSAPSGSSGAEIPLDAPKLDAAVNLQSSKTKRARRSKSEPRQRVTVQHFTSSDGGSAPGVLVFADDGSGIVVGNETIHELTRELEGRADRKEKLKEIMAAGGLTPSDLRPGAILRSPVPLGTRKDASEPRCDGGEVPSQGMMQSVTPPPVPIRHSPELRVTSRFLPPTAPLAQNGNVHMPLSVLKGIMKPPVARPGVHSARSLSPVPMRSLPPQSPGPIMKIGNRTVYDTTLVTTPERSRSVYLPAIRAVRDGKLSLR